MKKMYVENAEKKKIAVVMPSLVAGFLIALWGYIQFFPTNTFHWVLSAAMIVSCTGPAILFQLNYRRKSMIDENLPRLLEDIAESPGNWNDLNSINRGIFTQKIWPSYCRAKKTDCKVVLGNQV